MISELLGAKSLFYEGILPFQRGPQLLLFPRHPSLSHRRSPCRTKNNQLRNRLDTLETLLLTSVLDLTKVVNVVSDDCERRRRRRRDRGRAHRRSRSRSLSSSRSRSRSECRRGR